MPDEPVSNPENVSLPASTPQSRANSGANLQRPAKTSINRAAGTVKRVTADPTDASVNILAAVQEAIGDAMAHLVRLRESPFDSAAEPKPTLIASFNFKSGMVIRPNVDPTKLPDGLPTRVLEALLRRGNYLSCVDWLLLPRAKNKQTTDDRMTVGDPSRAFRHSLATLRRFLNLTGVPIRITSEHGQARAMYDQSTIGSDVTDAANLAREARKRLRSSHLSEAAEYARQAVVLDPDCWQAATVISKVAQKHDDFLEREDTIRAELSLARAIMTAAAAVLRLNAKIASDFDEITRAHQRARNLLNWLARSHTALRSSIPPEHDEFRKMLGAIVELAIAVGRGTRDVSFDHLIKSPIIVALADELLGDRIGKDSTDRAAVLHDLTTRIVWLVLIHGVLPAATSAEAFISELADFLARRIDWASLLDRNDRRTIQYDDEVFESDEDDPHRQRSHRGRRPRRRTDDE